MSLSASPGNRARTSLLNRGSCISSSSLLLLLPDLLAELVEVQVTPARPLLVRKVWVRPVFVGDRLVARSARHPAAWARDCGGADLLSRSEFGARHSREAPIR